MNRLEQLRQVIDEIVRKNPDLEERRCGFVHLYGVSGFCALIALKRGLDPELCAAAGMLHDIWNYQVADCPEHDRLGAIEARNLLTALSAYTADEIDAICKAISTHGDKVSVDGEMAELLKDADVFQHYLYNPAQYEMAISPTAAEKSPKKAAHLQRLEKVFKELGVKMDTIRVARSRTKNPQSDWKSDDGNITHS